MSADLNKLIWGWQTQMGKGSLASQWNPEHLWHAEVWFMVHTLFLPKFCVSLGACHLL